MSTENTMTPTPAQAKPQTISRRDLLANAARAGAGAAVAATAGGTLLTATAAASQAPARMKRAPLATVTIKLSVWGDVQDLSVYQAIIKDFEASQNEIKVLPEQWTGDYYASMQTAMAAGTAPDVLYFQPWTWQPFAIDNVLLPLDAFIKRDKAHIPNVWAPSYNSSTQWNGHFYLAPADSNPMVMFYIKEMFDKAHVPYPKENWTMDDFVQVSKELTVKKGSKTVQYGYQPNYGDPYFRNQGFMRMGGHLESYPLIKPKKANFDDPLVTRGLQLQLGDLAKMGSAMPIGAILAGGGQNGYYTYGIQNGLAAMKVEGPWFMPQMTGPTAVTKGGLPFDVVPTPRQGNQWHAPSGVSGHTIRAASKYPEAGWELIKFVISDQGQRRIAEGGRTCSRADAIKNIWYPIASKLYGFKNYEAWAKTVTAADMIETGGVTSDEILLQGGFNSAVQAVGNFSQTAAQAFAPVNQKVQGFYDAWWAKHPTG